MNPRPNRLAADVGYVLKVFPRLSETFVINEMLELERQGTRLHVFSLHAPPADVPHAILRQLRAEVVIVDALESPSARACDAAVSALAPRLGAPAEHLTRLLPRKYVRLALQLQAAMRTHPVDALHAHFASRATHVSMLVSALSEVPYSFTAHAKDIYHRDVDTEVLRTAIARARLVVTVSRFNRRRLLEVAAGLPGVDHKIRRLYNGVDLTAFRVGDPPGPGVPRLLAVGRLVEKKGFPVLIDACARLHHDGVPFACDIVGSGDWEPRLRQQIHDRGVEGVVTLRGGLPLERVADEMQRAHAVVLPCVVAADGNVDALPTVLLEAMACGRPVISTDLSGIPEIVAHEETGFVVPAGDADALARAIRAVLQDDALAARFGRAARARAERLFDLRTNVAHLRQWLLSGAPVTEAST
jgi:glycosyltransferase involved in cell wall biosynthesis